MRIDREIVKQLHRQMLADTIDPVMKASGFSRTPASTIYKRSITSGGKQTIDVFFRTSPYHNPPEIAYISGILRISIPEVETVALDIVGDDQSLLGSVKDLTMIQNIGHVGPKKTYDEWGPRSTGEYPSAGNDLARFLHEDVLFFMDEYQSARDIVMGFEAGDTRLPRGRNWIIRVAAAFLATGYKDKASTLIAKEFGTKAGLRSQYAAALAYFGL